MLQPVQHLGNGKTQLVEVPAPGPQAGALLIRTTRSLISAGTERMLVEFGNAGWIGKARQQPEKVRAVFDKIRSDGLLATVRAVRAKLSQPIPLGYCQVGRVIAVGDDGSPLSVVGFRNEIGDREPRARNQEPITNNFAPGDRVVSNGPHAEVVSVSQALCAKVPDAVSDEAASFTPLCAIAIQGIGLLAVSPGDKVVVTGLGLIGQLATRILLAQGCEVMGLDPSPERRTLAEKSGASVATGDPVAAALAWSKGKGVAGVLITASTPSNEVVNQAARSCRHRGKVVLVGVVGLQLNRADFYRNEVSFQVSCSYGRRDGTGPGSVRDNFDQVLALMAAGRLPVEDLVTHRFAFTEAAAAYEALGDPKSLGVLLTYDQRPDAVLSQTVQVGNCREEAQKAQKGKPIRVAVVGAGNFAMRTLFPAMARLPDRPVIAAVASGQGVSALLAAREFGAERATTDLESIFNDPQVRAVFLATRHDAHARQALVALRAGKHVWVEKPLCLDLEELHQIEAVIGSKLPVVGEGQSEAVLGLKLSVVRQDKPSPTSNPRPATNNDERRTPSVSPTLMVGFNRRFAPLAVALKRALVTRGGPYRLTVTVNAGRLEAGHWTLDPQAGGGRILGEGCHFVDLARYLVGTTIKTVNCSRRDADGQDGGAFELQFVDGSSAMLDYRTDLPAHVPKEFVEISGTGFSAQIVNWSKLRSRGLEGLSQGGFWSRAPRKGHSEALEAFLRAVQGGPEPIALGEIFEVSRWAIRMQRMEQAGETAAAEELHSRSATESD